MIKKPILILNDFWAVKPPLLYRYENKEFIDLFFNTGKLRLASFSLYKSYPDNVLGDTEEGRTVYMKQDSIGIVRRDGQNAFTFCTSLSYDNLLMNKFNRNGCFRIVDPTAFGLAISKSIMDFIRGIEGYCIYLTTKFQSEYEFPSGTIASVLEALKSNPNLLSSIGNIGSENPNNYFYKKLDYSYQQEYRFLFFINKNVTGFIDIECPEAVKFCEKIEE